jgi:hypothetical protein
MSNPIPVRGGLPPVKAMPARPSAPVAEKETVTFTKIEKDTTGDRIVLYGSGGTGKTTLACSLPGPVAFFDFDKRLEKLGKQPGADKLLENVIEIKGVETWEQLRRKLQAAGWDSIRSIVIDSLSVAQAMAITWMFENIKEKGAAVTRMEDYGYKAGYRHLFDTFCLLFADLDAHVKAGRHVVLICHDADSKVPNPQGLDWLRSEPRLENEKNCQLRFRIKEWADHVLFVKLDVNVGKDGKGQGCGTRTVYTSELPHCMAKSRTTQGDFALIEGDDFWSKVIY